MKFMKNTIRLVPVLVLIIGLASCVSQKKYTELEASQKRCSDDLTMARQQNLELTTERTELTSRLGQLMKEAETLRNDTTRLGMALRDSRYGQDRLQKSYQELLANSEESLTGNKAEIQKILAELQLSQEKLLRRQDSIRNMEYELAMKQKKLIELQRVLAAKDSAVTALRKKVTDALLGFQGKGLTIETRNGKVYVSLEESLLFQSGSYTIGSRGEAALGQLAGVLASNRDINVLIEGHTDNVPYKGTGQLKDNWDLSVMRATAVVKILTKGGKVDPSRLTAAGRSEYLPVASNQSTEGRASNRRTEIILTPKLDELFQVIESN